MSVRTPLPLRWLLAPPALSSGEPAGMLAVYKPAGLPYFAASQVDAASGDARRLFEIRRSMRVEGGGDGIGTATAIQPTPEDTSNSLATRLVDALPPGATPLLTLPLVSSALLTGAARRGGGSARATAQQVNSWTARYKGATLVSPTAEHAMFIRNASRMGFVTHTFHVLVRLPDDVARNARAQSRKAAQQQTESRRKLLNPYVAEMAERGGAGSFSGVHGLGSADGVETGVAITDLRTGELPASLRHDGLVEGSFVDWRQGRLRYGGTVAAYLQQAASVPAGTAAAAQIKRRISGLFLPTGSSAQRPDDGGQQQRHPWLPPEHTLMVSVDPAATDGQRRRRGVDGAETADGDSRGGGRRVAFEYTLLALGLNSGAAPLALYEVRGGHISPEEVTAVFAAEGLFVMNDFINDGGLAAAVARVAEEVRASSCRGALANSMPMAIRHRLQQASPEELVASVLARQPLLAADSCALATLLADAEAAASVINAAATADGGYISAEFLEHLRKATHTGATASFLSDADAMGRAVLSSIGGSTQVSDGDARSVLQLSLGPGIECVSIAFPEPSIPGNTNTLQHAMARFEDNRLDTVLRGELIQSMHYSAAGLGGSSVARAAGAAARDEIAAGSGLYGVTVVPRGFRLPTAGGGRAPRRGAAAHHDVAEDVSSTFALALATGLNAPDSGTSGDNDNIAAAAAVVSRSDVPPTFAPFLAHWAQQRGLLVNAEGDDGSEERREPSSPGEGGTSLLFPTRQELANAASTTVSPRDGTAARDELQQLGDDNFDVEDDMAEEDEGEHTNAGRALRGLRPLVVRAEELGAFLCTACGGKGHAWQCCPRTHVHQLSSMLPPASPTAALGEATVTPLLAPGEPQRGSASSPVSMELMGSVGEASDAIAAADDRRADAAAFAADDDGGRGLVAVPSVAPTVPLNIHALRKEAKKPPMQRRSLRCAYCHGQHHITQCPRLQEGHRSDAEELVGAVAGGQSGTGAPNAVIDEERLRSEPEKLFCIKCGAHGHIYTACPRIPDHLHTALHCPICLQSVTTIQHRPVHCPRRVSLPSPAEYFPNGIPRSFVTAAPGAGAGRAHQRRQATLRKRKKGSMLIADTYVDGQ